MFLIQVRRMTNVLLGIFFAKKRHKCGVSIAFPFIVFRSPWDVIEHRHEDDPSFKIILAVCSFLTRTLWPCCRAAMWWIHWLTINCVQSSVLWWTLQNKSTFWFIFPRHNTESEKNGNLHVRETDDFFITNQRLLFPWRIFPVNWSHFINLIWLSDYQLLRCQTSVFIVRLFSIFWWSVNFLSIPFPWI